MFQDAEIQTLIVNGSAVGLFLIGFVLAVVIRYQARQQRHLNETERLNASFQQTILQTQIEIQEQTLKTISQELHDNIGQALSLARLNLHTLPTTEAQKLLDVKQVLGKALNDLRDLSRSMHGDRVKALGLRESIANELLLIQNSGQFTTALTVSGEDYELESGKEIILFRVVQEALNNAVKYSRAQHIEIKMLYEPSLFVLEISDNGIGFHPAALVAGKTGIGLANMRDRTSLIGGTFSVQSDAGTHICLRIPIQASLQPVGSSSYHGTALPVHL